MFERTVPSAEDNSNLGPDDEDEEDGAMTSPELVDMKLMLELPLNDVNRSPSSAIFVLESIDFVDREDLIFLIA